MVLLIVLSVSLSWPHTLDGVARACRVADTVYADGFTPRAFGRIRVGMPRSEVAALVGRGYRTFTDGPDVGPGTADQSTWFYSISGLRSDNHWRYRVEFDTQGTVQRTTREFWWD